ncbi:TPA: hypothetical protein KKX77_002663 [Legionella pneumophila]|nr:hypothetical protein [Legionella pneumophila]HCU5995192.1 hypothetical protein [Legionella pneumophila]
MKSTLIFGLIVAILGSQSSFAGGGHHSNDELGQTCLMMTHHLNRIANSNEHDSCSGDVRVAGAYLQSASYALFNNKTRAASVPLTYARNELKEIAYNRSYCEALASSVKPFLAQVILIQGELDAQNVAQAEGGALD